MLMTPSGHDTGTDQRWAALDFEFPTFIAKLVKERIADSPEEAELLFRELKRFLVLIRTDSTMWDMYSRRVDEAWHQFVLFTSEYTRFCQHHFGEYVHHSPGIVQELARQRAQAQDDQVPAPHPGAPDGHGPNRSSHEGFRRSYEAAFGEPLPAIWWDATSVAPHRRIIHDDAGRCRVRPDPETGQVELIDEGGTVLLSVNDLAAAALRFVAEMPAFYVRELPGDLTDEERVALVTVLVRAGTVRIAP